MSERLNETQQDVAAVRLMSSAQTAFSGGNGGGNGGAIHIFECPHCKQMILVQKNELNCCIFRHGVFKNSGEPIHPHLSKSICDKLYETGMIYGCGKPFRVQSDTSGNLQTIICDYI